jgi:hypothetical protein
MVEEMAMHNEELYGKMNLLKTMIKSASNKVLKCVEINEITSVKIDDF